MTGESYLFDMSFLSAADMRLKQYYAMKLLTTTQDSVDVPTGATDDAFCILQNDPNTGQVADVRVLGISRAVTDGNAAAIAIGDKLGTNNAGKLVKKTADHDVILATALEASTADGQIISVLMTGRYSLSA